jgi:hypothetical protein
MQNYLKVMHMVMDGSTLQWPYMDITLVGFFVFLKYKYKNKIK